VARMAEGVPSGALLALWTSYEAAGSAQAAAN
jgi:hypothetical protein